MCHENMREVMDAQQPLGGHVYLSKHGVSRTYSDIQISGSQEAIFTTAKSAASIVHRGLDRS